MFNLDLYIRKVVIPSAELERKTDSTSKIRVPIPVHEIANKTNHTPDYIQKVLEEIDNKAWLRQRLKIYPILPEIRKVKI